MDALAAYIAADNPAAALRALDRIEATAERLGHAPIGRRGRVAGTYEKPVGGLPYIIAYALQVLPTGDERVVILHVIHGARSWRKGEMTTPQITHARSTPRSAVGRPLEREPPWRLQQSSILMMVEDHGTYGFRPMPTVGMA